MVIHTSLNLYMYMYAIYYRNVHQKKRLLNCKKITVHWLHKKQLGGELHSNIFTDSYHPMTFQIVRWEHSNENTWAEFFECNALHVFEHNNFL